jgi:hypothetical protein
VAALGAVGLVKLPPVVLLVRHLPDSLISYFFKWRTIKDLGSLDSYVARGPSAQGVDLWWFIRFFNRWGLLRRTFPGSVMVVRYEDVQHDPETWVRRIWAHWGVELDERDVAAGLAVASREAVQAALDPAYGEDIAPDRTARAAVRYAEADAALLERRLARHLRYTFGYAAGVEAAQPRLPVPVLEPVPAAP